MKEQIEEIARVLNECCNRYDENGNHLSNKCSQCEYWDNTNHLCCSYNTKEATALYNAGYRKQKEGEWKPIMQELGYCDTLKCSICGEMIDVSQGYYKYCPNCGAKMKGAAHE